MKRLLLLLLLLVPSAFAVQYHFTTYVNLTVSNTTFRFHSEDAQTRIYSLGSNLVDVVSISLNRNITCTNSSSISQSYLSSIINESMRTQLQYTNCSIRFDYLKATCVNNTVYQQCLQRPTTYPTTTCPIQKESSQQTIVVVGGICLAVGYFLGRKGFAKGPTENLPQYR
jgi:hypothetical protein